MRLVFPMTIVAAAWKTSYTTTTTAAAAAVERHVQPCNRQQPVCVLKRRIVYTFSFGLLIIRTLIALIGHV